MKDKKKDETNLKVENMTLKKSFAIQEKELQKLRKIVYGK